MRRVTIIRGGAPIARRVAMTKAGAPIARRVAITKAGAPIATTKAVVVRLFLATKAAAFANILTIPKRESSTPLLP